MEFVERKVTQEDREWLDQFGVYEGKSSGYGKYLVEDKEENACMVQTFGQGAMNREGKYLSEIPIISTLIWRGHVIEMESYEAAYHSIPGDLRSPRVILYSISRIWAKYMSPEELKEFTHEREEIKQMIQEAFFAWQDATGTLKDENGKSIRDENGKLMHGKKPFAEKKMLYMAEPENF